MVQIEGFNNFVQNIHQGVDTVKEGVMSTGAKVSYYMNDLYGMSGLTCICKVLIADIRFLLEWAPETGHLFGGMLKTVEGQKDLYYGTSIFSSWAEFVRENPETGKKELRNPGVVKVLAAIGDFFETGRLLVKYANCDFPLFSRAAETIGAVSLFGNRWNETPVLQTLCKKPKDFFVFIASAIDTSMWTFKVVKARRGGDEEAMKGLFSWENRLKIAGCIGKMILIYGGMSNKNLCIVDVLTQHASLIKHLVCKHNQRQEYLPDEN